MKPAAAVLKLWLATPPMLFAAEMFPKLGETAGRRFKMDGDADRAFQLRSGLDETKLQSSPLSRGHFGQAAGDDGASDREHDCGGRGDPTWVNRKALKGFIFDLCVQRSDWLDSNLLHVPRTTRWTPSTCSQSHPCSMWSRPTPRLL